jgi:hypothetical protein
VLWYRLVVTAERQEKQGGVSPRGETPEKVIPITRPKALPVYVYTISGVLAVIQPYQWWNRRKKALGRSQGWVTGTTPENLGSPSGARSE